MTLNFWPFVKRPDPLLAAISILIDQQGKTQQAVMATTQAMAEATSKQAEVLSAYLKLFQTPGEPQRWEEDPEADNKEELMKMGFPTDGSEKDQAEWVMANIHRL